MEPPLPRRFVRELPALTLTEYTTPQHPRQLVFLGYGCLPEASFHLPDDAAVSLARVERGDFLFDLFGERAAGLEPPAILLLQGGQTLDLTLGGCPPEDQACTEATIERFLAFHDLLPPNPLPLPPLDADEALRRADLTSVSLAGARLVGADLSGVFLSDVDLSGADLTGARLVGARLSRVNLRGARLEDAALSGVRWVQTTCPDGTSSDDSPTGCAPASSVVNVSRGATRRPMGYPTRCRRAAPLAARFAALDYATLERLTAERRRFILFYGSASCGASNQLEPLIAEVAAAHQLQADLYTLASPELLEHLNRQLPATVKLNATPTLLFFVDGQLADLQIGSVAPQTDRVTFLHALSRNGFISEQAPRRVSSPREVRQHLQQLHGLDLAGFNLAGLDLSGASLAGADLRGADLRGADLTGAILSRADLTGAQLKGARLEGAFFKHTTCPDGVVRDPCPLLPP